MRTIDAPTNLTAKIHKLRKGQNAHHMIFFNHNVTRGATKLKAEMLRHFCLPRDKLTDSLRN